jgi:hypothetical protein
MRALAHWTGVAMLLAFGALGLWGVQGSLGSIGTVGQLAATVTQLGYALVGVVAAWALVRRPAWAPTLLWLWAVLLTITGGLAPVVGGGSGLWTGLAAGAASAAIAGLTAWLASHRL